ncbi:TolC family outer membrane protein [Aureimonas frigidaquae]|uniref:Type I secretion outer membrane family protein n=1 Tax=Aureimonas frigidaquae TaxID=424757 RepID=A0A0P0Z4S1_9HYPH|nr:TolC family outer membrane protein [Aureimonas frigidaquae]BAT28988.1 type I secretion outer membrane family protein [Aureimonas frigidaquae]
MRKGIWLSSALSLGLMMAGVGHASAETLRGALAKAYANNQTLNAARAALRATDENVPQARAGLRPTIGATASGTLSRGRTTRGDGLPNVNSRAGSLSAGIEINQVVFDGFQTPNNIQSAQAAVRAGQANLANTVQNTLLDAATAYMDVIRDRQIAELRRQNLGFLREQVRAANARFDVGEGTRTDVAQAESEQALSTALLNSALAQVAASEAVYLQIVGDVPDNLTPGTRPPEQLMPKSISSALSVSLAEHPAIQAGLFAVDAAAFEVKSIEGRALPQLSVGGSVDNTYTSSAPGTAAGLPGVDINVASGNDVSASVGATLTIPLYQGGLVASQVRQAKEVLGQRRIDVDSYRDQVRAAVASAWALIQAAEANVTGYRAQVAAARLALNGVQEERTVGQRTTLDVLDAQADVLSAQILLAGAQRDVVVRSYELLSAVGRLSATQLALGVQVYDPEIHYQAVHDKWYGMKTPDGR